MPQFRTTRHIDGNYTLKEEDAYRNFEDSVCAICYFDRKDFLFEVPYGTMVRSGFDNVIAVGRCAAGEVLSIWKTDPNPSRSYSLQSK